MVTDPVADILTRIRNAQNAGHRSLNAPYSRLCEDILSVLKTEGFIEGFEVKTEGSSFRQFSIFVKYDESGNPAIHEISRVSRSGKRVYSPSKELPRVASGVGISIISTSSGVISDREARKKNIGGEILARVW